MDRNSIIGLVLIALIMFVWMWQSAPTEEELREQHRKDSIALVENERQRAEAAAQAAEETADSATPDTVALDSSLANLPDSVAALKVDSMNNARLANKYLDFGNAATGQEQLFTIENDELIATISSKGGRIVSVQLKNYQTYDSTDLYLFDPESSRFNLEFWVENRSMFTEDFYFEPVGTSFAVTGEESNELAMRLYGKTREDYIEYRYSLSGTGFMMDMDVAVNGLDHVLRSSGDNFQLLWEINAPGKEKSLEAESKLTTVYFRYKDEDPDNISETSFESEELIGTTDWVAFKQQFFSAAIISPEGFGKDGAEVATEEPDDAFKYTKKLRAELSVPLPGRDPDFPMQFYFGPNHVQTLEELELGLEDQINLGWTIFGWVNRGIVIPIFNWLDSYAALNYGIIILILTLLIKTVLFPLTYRNYKSSAKMKVLKPEVDEINKKFEGKDAASKQQAVMALYRKAGVNPLAGCIPMVLQIPILYAMFRFFPASIELRQQSFLWAEDLSSYDSVLDLPFEIPFYGDHVSLFTLLMAISTFLYSRYNMQMSQGNTQLPQMKVMIYMMPFMLLFFFNSYSSALSYYYFTANIISVAQQLIIKRYFIDEKAIHAQIQANKKKPQKKSKFQQRMEEVARQRGMQQPPKRKR